MADFTHDRINVINDVNELCSVDWNYDEEKSEHTVMLIEMDTNVELVVSVKMLSSGKWKIRGTVLGEYSNISITAKKYYDDIQDAKLNAVEMSMSLVTLVTSKRQLKEFLRIVIPDKDIEKRVMDRVREKKTNNITKLLDKVDIKNITIKDMGILDLLRLSVEG